MTIIMTIMFDTHCHLQDERIIGQVDAVIDRAARAGVRRMLCCGSEESDWADVARIGAGYGGAVSRAYGVHPWYVDRVGEGWDARLEGYLSGDASAAVGEIGFDHAVDPRNDAKQADIFTRQLEIAEHLKRPVSIHCRRAWGSLLSILREAGGLRFGGAVHSYSGPPDLVGELENLGCGISFSGSILAPGSRRAVESLKIVSPDRLLIETDSPDILPRGAPGPHNEPANLTIILYKAAEILGEPPETVAQRTYDNAVRLFVRMGELCSPAPPGLPIVYDIAPAQ